MENTVVYSSLFNASQFNLAVKKAELGAKNLQQQQIQLGSTLSQMQRSFASVGTLTQEVGKALNSFPAIQEQAENPASNDDDGESSNTTLIEDSQAAIENFKEAFDSGEKGLNKAQQASQSFQDAWENASQGLAEGQSFFKVLQSSSQMVGQGISQAKESFSLLGSTIKEAKQGIGVTQTAFGKIGALFKNNTAAANDSNQDSAANDDQANTTLAEAGQAAASSFKEAYSSGSEGLEKAQAASQTFQQAWDNASKGLAEGQGFFNVLQSSSVLVGQGFSQAKESFNLLGSAIGDAKQGLTSTRAAFGKIGALFKKNKTAANDDKNEADNPPAEPLPLGEIWNQGLQAKETINAAYESGAQGVDQAQQAADTLKGAWQQATDDIKSGKGFFTALSNASPKIGEGINQAKASFNTFKETVGQAKEGFAQVKSVAQSASGFFKTHVNKANIGKMKAAGLQTMTSGVSKLGSSLTAVARGAIPAVAGGMRALGAAFLTNPIGLAITGIALAAGLIIRYWEPIKTFFSGIWDSIKPVFTQAWEWIKTIIGFSPIGLLVKSWEPISNFFGSMWAKIKSVFKAGVAWVQSKVLAPFNAIKNTLGGIKRFLFGDDKKEEKAIEDKTVKVGKVVSLQQKAKPAVAAAATGAALGAALVATPIAADSLHGSQIPAPANQQQLQVTKNAEYQINVQATPGMDEQQLALMVRQQMEEHQRNEIHDSDRSLYD